MGYGTWGESLVSTDVTAASIRSQTGSGYQPGCRRTAPAPARPPRMAVVRLKRPSMLAVIHGTTVV